MSNKQFFTWMLMALVLPAMVLGQGVPHPSDQDAVIRDQILGQLKYGEYDEEEDISFDYEKSPGRAFLMSMVVPGTGQLYADAKWRALIYAGVEAVGWTFWATSKAKGNRLEEDYQDYADQNWALDRWYINSLTNEQSGPSRGSFGSHHIYVEYQGMEYQAHEDTLNKYLPDWESLMASGTIDPIRTRDFYENIGKYDQFAGGWDDFSDYNAEADTLYMSPLRDDYLTQRLNSNDAFKMATNFVYVLMFNHLISAFDANIAAKKYRSEDQVSWHVGLVADYRYRMPLRGVRLSVAF